MNNQEVSTAYVGSTEIKEARLGTQLVLAPGGDALWYKANEIPTLDLRFADNKSLVDAATGQNLVTSSRASGGTYTDSQGVIRTALDNEPRFDHNPSTGESLGLLVEEQRSNLLLRSEEFDNASWIKADGSVTLNAVTSPNGTTTADLFIPNTNVALHRLTQSYAGAASTAYCFSVYVKTGGASDLSLGFQGNGEYLTCNYNFSTGVITAPSGTAGYTNKSSQAQNLSNGWVRLSIIGTTPTVGFASIFIQTPITTSAGDGTSGIYIWGAQLEAGAFPTSYIKTEAATATRAADVASITGTNFSSWYNASAGTIYSDHLSNAVPGITFVGQLGDSTANYYDVARYQTPLRVYATSGGSTQATLNTALTTGSRHKTAFAVQLNDFAFTADGLTPTADTSGAMPLVATKLSIGNDLSTTTGREINGTIKRITFWPQRLSNATLQTLTQ